MSKVYTDLHINGKLIYNNNPTNGYILTTDNLGVVSWTASINTIATASDTTSGNVIVGGGLTMSSLGVLSVSGGGGGSEYFPGVGLTLSGSTFSLSYKKHKIIYVSATGSNINDGYSSMTPLLDLYVARDLALSGDTIVVLPGNYIFDNRSGAGCPYNGFIQSKVNLWKDGVTYHFLPGAKIYSYGSTSTYSPTSENMVFFQPNSATFSECFITGDLEFYAISEGASLSLGSTFLFFGEEVSGTPGYNFYMKAKIVEGVTGTTPLRANRTIPSSGPANINLDIDTVKYGYTTGQANQQAFSIWRGGDNSDMVVNIKINQIIGGGTSWYPIFKILTYSSTGINNLKINIDIKSATMLGSSYLLSWNAGGSTSQISSGQIKFNCDSCIFSPSLFMLLQTFKNYYITITGNYYCSGTLTNKSSLAPTYGFIVLWDQTNDATSDNTVLDFKGNYYANNSGREVVYVGGNGGGLPYGVTNHICNYTGDIYFTGTASNYTGRLIYMDMGKMRFSGRIHGTTNYSGYGFNGSVLVYGSHPSSVTITNSYIHSDLNSSLVSYGNPVAGQNTLVIDNSFIDMSGTSSVIANLANINTYVQNTTIRNKGTNDLLYNSLNTGTLQITNSTLISSSTTASTIKYPLGTITSAGVYSNKDIIVSTLNGTVSVVTSLV